MAKELNIEIPAIHEYDRDADKSICRVQITPAFYEILKLLVVKGGTIGYSSKEINNTGGVEWKTRTRYKVKAILATDNELKSLNNYEWLLGQFFDVELWDNEPVTEVLFNMTSLKEYYEITNQFKKFFDVVLNTAAATKTQITKVFKAKFEEYES